MFFFFNVTATTDIYTYSHTLSLPDALAIASLQAFFQRIYRRKPDGLLPSLRDFVGILHRHLPDQIPAGIYSGAALYRLLVRSVFLAFPAQKFRGAKTYKAVPLATPGNKTHRRDPRIVLFAILLPSV